MNESEIAELIGKLVVQNWTYFLGVVVAFISGCVLLSWRISKSLHQRECQLLKIELDFQKERFSQFETVMEQRINLLKSGAELLSNKINPSKTTVLYQSSGSSKDTTDKHYVDMPAYLRKGDIENQGQNSGRLKQLLDKTDFINNIIKVAMAINP